MSNQKYDQLIEKLGNMQDQTADSTQVFLSEVPQIIRNIAEGVYNTELYEILII